MQDNMKISKENERRIDSTWCIQVQKKWELGRWNETPRVQGWLSPDWIVEYSRARSYHPTEYVWHKLLHCTFSWAEWKDQTSRSSNIGSISQILWVWNHRVGTLWPYLNVFKLEILSQSVFAYSFLLVKFRTNPLLLVSSFLSVCRSKLGIVHR